MEILREAGVERWAQLACPIVSQDGRTAHTMVHSKVMIVDDVLLRVGVPASVVLS